MTNRQLIKKAQNDINTVADNMVIGPTCLGHLTAAVHALNEALRFVLDEQEQDTGKFNPK